jgi:uncharacterized protein (DUF1778 family)
MEIKMPRAAVDDNRPMNLRVAPEVGVIKLSQRDYERVMALLEDPPAPNAKMLAAAKMLPQP